MKYLSAGALFLISTLVIIVFLSAVLPPKMPWAEGFATAPYSTFSANQPIDSGISYLIDPTKEKECKKIYGFDGLFCNPESGNKGIDVFYGLPSNSTCLTGSGLTKSNGNLCLDGAAFKLLTTRGGNATGSSSTDGKKDSTIGI
jgi:hypothetical protein